MRDPNASNTNLFLIIGGREHQKQVPRGFWLLPHQDRVSYILGQWPTATWAGNGEPNPLFSCSHQLNNR